MSSELQTCTIVNKVITNAEVSVHLNANSELTLIVTLAIVMDKVTIINYDG